MRNRRSPRRGRRRRASGLLLAGTVAAVTAGATALRASPPASVAERAGAPSLPAPVPPAFTPRAPRRLPADRPVSHWAPVLRTVSARAAPRPDAPAVAALDTVTPEGTPNLVTVLGHREDGAGRPWVHVRLAVLPNGSSGWVPRTALGGYTTVRTHLYVDLARLRADLYRGGRRVLRLPVAVGMPGWPTPKGTFYVRNKLTRYRSPAYGPVAFGTSGRSPMTTGWPAGGFVGIHGTDRPDLIPGRVSHGCIRLRNADIRALAARMPVGTPVTIR
jgi:lipoprotein-anchoring transpeptidase ErfK/SrfK